MLYRTLGRDLTVSAVGLGCMGMSHAYGAPADKKEMTELLNTVAPSETKTMVEQFYEQAGMTPDVIANAVLYALSQPDSVNVSDLVVRPAMES